MNGITVRINLQSLNLLNAYPTIDERLPRLASWLAENPPTVFSGQEILTDQKAPGEIHQPTAKVISEAGLTLAVGGVIPSDQRSGNAIWFQANELELVAAGESPFPFAAGLRAQQAAPVYAVFRTPANFTFLVFSVHLSWGAEKSIVRYRNLRSILAKVDELLVDFPNAKVFVNGDFNTPPENDEMRFLRGETLQDPGEFWVDAWTWLHPEDVGFTQYPASEYASQTARRNGIEFPSSIPRRRLDYLMIRGWVYGKLGPDPQMSLWGGTDVDPISDHLGLQFTFDV